MKKKLLLFVMLLIAFGAYAQTEPVDYKFKRKSFMASTSLNFGWSNHSVLYSHRSSLGFFPIDNLAIGISSGQYFYGGIQEPFALSNRFGIFSQYYFGNRRMKPFVGLGLDVNSTMVHILTDNGISVPVMLGLNYSVNNRFSLNLDFLSYYYPNAKRFSKVTPNIGIQFTF